MPHVLLRRTSHRAYIRRWWCVVSGWDSQHQMSWRDLHRHLSVVEDPLAAAGDLPVSRKRERPPTPTLVRGESCVPYAELHVHSNFSFLDGASHPEELVAEAVRLGLSGLALTDHDGFYGVVMFANAARDARPANHFRRGTLAEPARRPERSA
jgi:PHP domain